MKFINPIFIFISNWRQSKNLNKIFFNKYNKQNKKWLGKHLKNEFIHYRQLLNFLKILVYKKFNNKIIIDLIL